MSVKVLLLLAGVAVLGVAASFAFSGNPPPAPRQVAATIVDPGGIDPIVTGATAAPADRAIPESQLQIQLSFAPIVKAVKPSVVNVYATTVTQSQSPFAGDPFFERFFGGNPFETRPRESQSLGSGVIVDAAGVILTNSHVVEGATDIRITTADNREFPVDLVLDDKKTDLAVLKVRDPNGVEFPAIGFADSDVLEVGDLVLAIGNPFGVGQTVTSGIVSALARTGVESSNYEFFIQTDAAINPGNSGGALVDMAGRLVGINTAIFTRSGGSVGIGFAIPANMARVVADAGIGGGKLVRPWFGARMQEVTADIADSLGLDLPHGALITEVAANGTAARAGLLPGDVILSVDDFAVDQPSAFDFRVATKAVGSSVVLGFFRNGEETKTSIVLEAPPGAGEQVLIDGNTRFRGATVETMSPAAAQELGLPFDAAGVLIRTVEQGSPADRMGLRPGDVIMSLNGRDTVDAAEFARAADGRPDSWQIVLQRDGRTFQTFVSG